LRFRGVHIGDPPPNQATTFESQQTQGIQYVFGQTFRVVAHSTTRSFFIGLRASFTLSAASM
jgi:hypothetical protein